MRNPLLIILFVFTYITNNAQADTTDKVVNVNEVIISANKFEEKQTNVAQRVQVITANDLKRMNAQTTADVLTLGGEVFVQKSQQGGGSPMLRGFEASRVLLVVDGVRMNNIQYRAGHLQNVLSVDNNMLDRVEVLFGPSSTMYGSDALGGVVHMRTKNPTLATDKKFYTSGNGMFRYGTVNNELTGHLDVNLAGRKFGSLTSFTYSKFGDLRQGNYLTNATAGYWDRTFYQSRVNNKDSAIANGVPALQVGSGYSQYDVLQKFLFQQTENISHVINVQFSNSTNIPRYDRLAELNSTTILRDGEWYYGPQRRLLAIYDFNWKNVGGKDGKTVLDNISIGANYQNLQESRNNRGFGKTFRTERTETINVGGFHADFKKVIKQHDIYFGAEGQFNDLKSTAVQRDVIVDTTAPASTRYPDGKNKMNYVALYAAHNWQFHPKVQLSSGVRYNFVNMRSTFTAQSNGFFPLPYNDLKNTYHAVSGNIGLVVQPGAGFRIAALASTGFRAPNVDDMSKVFESVPGTVIVPNSSLKPEYTVNVDLTLEKTFAKRFRISATGFYTYFFNAITADKAQFNGQDSIEYDGVISRVISLQNKNRAYIAGVTAKAEADVTNWMSVYASVTYTYGRILTDTTPYPLDHIAPVYGKAGFRANYKWVRGEFFALFAGKKKVEDYNMQGEDNFGQATPDGMPAWATLNMRIGFQPVKYMSIDLGCDNLMDLRYRNFASGISAPGRNFFVTARFNW